MGHNVSKNRLIQRFTGQVSNVEHIPTLYTENSQNSQSAPRRNGARLFAGRRLYSERCTLKNKRVIVLIISKSSQQSHVASKVIASEFASQYNLEWVQSSEYIGYEDIPNRVVSRLSDSPDSGNTSDEEEEEDSSSEDELNFDWLFCNKRTRSDLDVNTSKKIYEPEHVYTLSLRRVVEFALQNLIVQNARFMKVWSKNETDSPPGHLMPLKQTLRYLLAIRNTIPCVWAKHVLDRMPTEGVFVLEGFNTKDEICAFKDAGAKIILVESNGEVQSDESSACRYSLCDFIVNQDVDLAESLKRIVNEGALV